MKNNQSAQKRSQQTISNLFLLVFLLASFSSSVFSSTGFAQTIQQNNKPIPVLDKTKSYPSKKIEQETEITYIPLETSEEVLLGGNCQLKYVSNEKLVLSDEIRGDVFIFDKDGKILSNFNQKGGLGYTFITSVAFDEKNSEVIILDRIKKKIFVFSEKGNLLRSFMTPKSTYLMEIYNFNDSTLLALDENMNGSDKPTKPYLFISKNDGLKTGYVDIEVKKVNPSQFIESSGKNQERTFMFTHSRPDNCKFGNDFILANKSMDTIYLLKQDKTLIPLFIQTPSVYSDHTTAASVGMITDRFLKINVASYDIKAGVKIMKVGRRWKPKFRDLILDRESGEFFEDSGKGELVVKKVDVPKNYCVELMLPMHIINSYKSGRLKDNLQLKEVASKLDIGDNPVIKIIRLK